MGFFGKTEKELNEIAKELETKELELKNRESDVKRNEENIKHERELLESEKSAFAKERADYLEEVKRTQQQLASDRSQLETRRQELVRLESEAKVNFARIQEEAFKDVIEKRNAALDSRKAELDNLAKKIASDLAAAVAKEGEIAKRELAVTEREQRADAGFADKASALAAENERQCKANQQIAKQLKEREEALALELQNLETAKEALRQREQKVAEAERQRDAQYSDLRTALDKELNSKQTEWQNELDSKRKSLIEELAERKNKLFSALDAQIEEMRATRFAELNEAEEKERTRLSNEAQADAERIRKSAQDDAEKTINSAKEEANRVRNEIQNERKEWDAEKQAQKAELKKQNEANEKKESELSNKEDELNGKKHELDLTKNRLDTRAAELKKEFDSLVAEQQKTFDAETEGLKSQLSALRDSLQIQTGLVGAFDQLQRQLGNDDPAEVIRNLNSKTKELLDLREKLANRPTEERYEQLEAEAKNQKDRADKLKEELSLYEEEVALVEDLRRKNLMLEADNKTLGHNAELFEAQANEAHAELKRLRAAYEHTEEEADRKKEIEQPHIEKDKYTPPEIDGHIDEMDWLNEIYQKCKDYGIKFNKRILKAFHTAVKTAEWSPLTVLAGVSGTGKSELPKLYSHFGGLLFEMVSVQPNWDSQESMLGFFNSIDNKFDAQPVLHFLAQSQKDYSDEYPGLRDAVCMILLDEMNLAHPELYFAEFLSKLENRRGKKKLNELPDLDVKIGAGMKPYKLPLGRNVLWTGTMNQDETTKSLSDKVLDRSIIIHFPRPTELKRRLELKPLDNKNRRPQLIHRKDFFKWFSTESPFSDKQIKPYKEFIEQINDSLSVAGRAIGHRVWQSVEYYMANYPDVRIAISKGGDESDLQKAMHIAFEDQLVQKVMPKLRGIDTRGKSRTDCLDKIRGQLNIGIAGSSFNLNEDFDLACELGYGQFIWMSANYLNNELEDSSSDDFNAGDVEVTSNNVSSAIPVPNWFSPGNPKREEIWRKLPREKQEEIISSIEHYNGNK